jgi:hypothetical protein
MTITEIIALIIAIGMSLSILACVAVLLVLAFKS